MTTTIELEITEGLKYLSDRLDTYIYDEKNYNSPLSYELEQFSQSMYKMSQDIKQLSQLLGGF